MDLKRPNTAFLSGVLSILLSQLVVKLTGLLYRLVITNLEGFGDVGSGFYTAGFQLYTLLLALSSVGIPSAISRLVSMAIAKGDRAEADRIFKTALGLFLGIGIACTAGLFLSADWIAVTLLRMDGVQATLRALAPSIIFVCISSVIRGYFLGLGDVRATGRSQMLEQVFKSVLTVAFVLALTACSAEVMSAGANFATTVAAAVSAVYLTGYSLRRRRTCVPPVKQDAGKRGRMPFSALCLTILKVSIPISLGAIVTGIGRVIDTATITRGIAAAFSHGIPGQSGIPSAAALNAEGVRLAGMLSKSDSLLNLPLALNIAFATVLVPTVSSALAVGRKQEAEEKISLSLLISVLLAFPCAAGLIVLARPIYQMLYPNAPLGYQLLQIGAMGMVFAALNQTINGSLQGIGAVSIPARALLCGVIVKIILNLLLIRIPSVNIYGAALGTLACYLVSSILCFSRLRRELNLSLPAGRYLWKPLLCTGGMSAVTATAYPLLLRHLHANSLSVLGTILLSAATYLALVLAAGVLTQQDIAQFPLSGKLQKWLLNHTV